MDTANAFFLSIVQVAWDFLLNEYCCYLLHNWLVPGVGFPVVLLLFDQMSETFLVEEIQKDNTE